MYKSENSLSVLVNTSDGFEDCWDPFFTLFNKYWFSCKYRIYLNTEFKKYSFKDLAIKTSEVGVHGKKLSWSECLIKALQIIDSPLILYFQEDYFLESKVDVEFLVKIEKLMLKDTEIKYIGLTHFGNTGPFYKSKYDNLVSISQNSKYRISTQVAMWRKETLLSYLRSDENGWMFEIFGSKRANRTNELFLTVDRNMFSKEKRNYIFKYLHTGIIKGRWHPNIPAVFEKHNISIDFSKRGFYHPKPFIFRKIETFLRLIKDPLLFFKKYFLNT